MLEIKKKDLWVEGQCQRCFTSFAEIKIYQKPLRFTQKDDLVSE
jgi:hypothetical protein